MFSIRLALSFVVVLTFFACPVGGQEIANGPTQLALEIHYYPDQPPALVPVGDATPRGSWGMRFRRVAGWTPPPNSLEVTAVNFKSVKAEDGVRVWVSVFLGKLHEQEQKVNAYLLHEGDKIIVQELAQVGVVPIEIKIIRITATVGAAPQFTSKAKSIELVSMQPNFSAPPSYEIVLRNTSGKTVNALATQMLDDGRPHNGANRQGEEGQPLIAPGGSYQMTVRLAANAKQGLNGYEPVALPKQTLEISSVVFGDGSFEGDARTAMAFNGFRIGRKLQLARVLDLFETALKDDSTTPDNLAALKSAVARLDLKADSAAVVDLQNRFPGVTQADVTETIGIGMKGQLDDVLKDITQFEIHQRHNEASAIREWLAGTRTRYHDWLARL